MTELQPSNDREFLLAIIQEFIRRGIAFRDATRILTHKLDEARLDAPTITA